MINKIRKNLINFKAFSSARSLYQSGVLLDANENPYGSVLGTVFGVDLNRYPDPYSLELKEALSKYVDMPIENIFVGNGSDEIIDLLISLFVELDEEIIITEPTYGMYRVSAEVKGIKVKNSTLTSDFQIDTANLISQITPKTKIIFLCSPNNPTGALIRKSEVENLCKNFDGIVVIDEAYIEFASSPSLANMVTQIPNLVVLRTFSKAWGLAGIRVGYALASRGIVEYLEKIKSPYNLNRLSSGLAIQALSQSEKMLAIKDKVLKEREKLAKNLASIGFEVFPSEANFLLVRYPNASKIAKALALDYKIIIRDFGNKPLLLNCLRISVGLPEQNELLIKSLALILNLKNEHHHTFAKLGKGLLLKRA